MANINDAQAITYRLANVDINWNPNAAITRHWLALKAQGVFLGVPIGNEMQLDDNSIVQAFTSGAVLRWVSGDAVEVL